MGSPYRYPALCIFLRNFFLITYLMINNIDCIMRVICLISNNLEQCKACLKNLTKVPE